MIVMKFGGSSVADAERLRIVADIIGARVDRRPLVVVSALAGVTSLLDEAARCARGRDGSGASRAIEQVGKRHALALEAVEDPASRASLAGKFEAILSELRLLLSGLEILGEATPRSLDAILAGGERLSSHLTAAVLGGRGLPARRVDARQVLVTDDRHGASRPLPVPTAERCERLLRPLLESGQIPVLGGFIGATGEGTTSTLGRGGSDLSASFLGALLGAEEIQIWTDVDGMMTADPRLVPSARILPHVSFDEAAELAYFGAKVLHPATIHPALDRDIPVRVLNTLRPASPGTLITRKSVPEEGRLAGASAVHAGGLVAARSRLNETPGPVKAIACKRGLTIVTVASTRMLMAHGFLAHIFEIFDRHETAVDLVSTSEVSVSLTVDDPRAIKKIREELSAFAHARTEDGMAIVCMVGEGLLRRSGIAARAFEALKEINVRMISLGASEINLSLVVADTDADKAVRLLHRAFLEGAPE